ncbi:hypothetical protein [Methanogenium cariaci]|uniref:dual OB domain-containing protein n=1 Tax=Methanogenium cariaci TaxID=2197 RepID=UPI000780E89F|nr:hypothetical protein [Methanogenium cariaci]
MYSREILILANSRKYGGRCIAGIDINTNEWIRPINNPLIKRDDPSVFMEDDLYFYYGIHFGPQLGDVVKIGFEEKCPLLHQPENELINGKKWEKICKMPYSSLKDLTKANSCDLIWYLEKKDKKTEDIETGYIFEDMIRANPVKESLALIHLTQSKNQTKIEEKKTTSGKLQTRLSFVYEGYKYDLVVTDETYPLLKTNVGGIVTAFTMKLFRIVM